MYFPYFIAYMTAGLLVSILVFWWALKNGQFKDQQRARFLPLYGDVDSKPVGTSRSSRIGVYVLFGIVCSGLVVSAVFVIFVLIKSSAISG
jgi:cbb3-type cytochrome oxidase maturation protein